MRWAWKIGKLAGIDVYMHATFLLLVGFIFVATWVESHNVAQDPLRGPLRPGDLRLHRPA